MRMGPSEMARDRPPRPSAGERARARLTGREGGGEGRGGTAERAGTRACYAHLLHGPPRVFLLCARLTMPPSTQLALTRHDDDLLTMYEARSAEVGGAAAAAAARAAVECGGTLTKAPSWWRHSSRPWGSEGGLACEAPG